MKYYFLFLRETSVSAYVLRKAIDHHGGKGEIEPHCFVAECVSVVMQHHSITGPVEVQRSGLGYGIVVQCLFRGLQLVWRFGEGIKEGVDLKGRAWRACSEEGNRVS